MKIDIFAHFLPGKYLEALGKKVSGGEARWFNENPALSQIDVRLRVMDLNPEVVQILNIATPPLETLVSPKEAVKLAKIANDEMAEVVAKYPNKFLSAIACLPLNNIDAAIEEADRAITQLHFGGVQIFTNINGEPLDTPKFMPLYKRMAQHDLPILIHPWLHPKSSSGNLETNPVSSLGWPFETTVAMGCLAQSQVFEDCPNIKFLTHHCGGMVPFFARRIAMPSWWRAVNAVGEERTRVAANFHKFYGDTALYGNTSALMCGYDYFGADHIVFGTDTPLGGGDDLGGGFLCSQDTVRSIEQMDIPQADKQKIFEDNARRLMRMHSTK